MIMLLLSTDPPCEFVRCSPLKSALTKLAYKVSAPEQLRLSTDTTVTINNVIELASHLHLVQKF